MNFKLFPVFAFLILGGCKWDQPSQIHYTNLESENPNAAPARTCTSLSCATSVLTLTAPAPYNRTTDNQYGYIQEYLIPVPNAQSYDFATVDVIITPAMIEQDIVQISMTSLVPYCTTDFTAGNYQLQTIYIYNDTTGQIVGLGVGSIPNFQPAPGVTYRVRIIIPQIDENAGDCKNFQFQYTLFMSTSDV